MSLGSHLRKFITYGNRGARRKDKTISHALEEGEIKERKNKPVGGGSSGLITKSVFFKNNLHGFSIPPPCLWVPLSIMGSLKMDSGVSELFLHAPF